MANHPWLVLLVLVNVGTGIRCELSTKQVKTSENSDPLIPTPLFYSGWKMNIVPILNMAYQNQALRPLCWTLSPDFTL